ncbi:MAG: hypothetical protein M3Q31_13465 [Actinomycetota bacterium]|nr:hypothetical protein [Actinomycetota bacterium]
MDALLPGGRAAGEGTKAFQAFTVYRELGPARSIAKVAQELGKSETIVGRWSADYGWVERASEWDDYADARARERDLAERGEALRKMNEEHARVGRSAVGIAGQKLAAYDLHAETAEARAAARTAIEALYGHPYPETIDVDGEEMSDDREALGLDSED